MEKLSVVIPTYNEVKRLPKTLSDVEAFLVENFPGSEIIISDGASQDGTVEYIKSYHSKIPIILLTERKREGKGYGVKQGVLKAKGDLILFMDADNSTTISQLKKFLPYINDADVLIASRYAGINPELKQNLMRRIIARAGNAFIRHLTGLKFNDTQCGFKLFKRPAAREIFAKLKTKGWGFDVEVLLWAKKSGFKVKEIPVKWRDAAGSQLRSAQDSINVLREVILAYRYVNRS